MAKLVVFQHGDLQTNVSSLLTQIDQEQSARDMKRGIRPNIYALSIMLEAGKRFVADVEAGTRPEVAFAHTFTPTRAIHRVAKALGLALDVDRGD